MIGSFRNFAKSRYAGILVGIIIIPFVFWGMGSVFSSGNTNSIAKINKENISTQDFIDHINQSNIPTDIQLLINNNEVGMVLLRLVEIIGEDDLENLDSDTLYFMSTILNQLNLDSIRNKILIKVLPLKI